MAFRSTGRADDPKLRAPAAAEYEILKHTEEGERIEGTFPSMSERLREICVRYGGAAGARCFRVSVGTCYAPLEPDAPAAESVFRMMFMGFSESLWAELPCKVARNWLRVELELSPGDAALALEALFALSMPAWPW
jgi:hypothetical protein